MKYRQRDLAGTLRRAMKTFPAALVTGSRQSGKTTMLREEFGGTHRYVSLERPDVRARALEDPVSFLVENPAPVILDEIQYAPDLLHYIKDGIDEDRRPGRWLLTGSQSFPLMQGVSQTLAGRIAVLALSPLSVAEAAGRAGGRRIATVMKRVFGGKGSLSSGETEDVDLVDWLLRGGYPEVRLNHSVDATLWFSSYMQTYIERDVRDMVRVGDLNAFTRFLFLLATRTGGLLNMAELGREAGVTGPTAGKWLSILEASQVVYLLRPHHRNLGKRIRKSPKLYLLDAGLATFLLGLRSREAVLQGPSLGPLVETAVVSEWVKLFRNEGLEPPIYYWRSSGGKEVDLVIEFEGRLHGIEIKATATPTPRHADGVAGWAELAGRDAGAVLACRIDRSTGLRPGIRAVPWHLAW